MCGIFGFFSGRGPLDPSLARQGESLDRLWHRGPNSSGWFADDTAALGFRRLAIVDPESGEQPLKSPDGRYVLAVNGEIYNHDALREELQGRHHFRTRSDAEVLVHRYVERGLDGLLDGVNGMFAFALYDRKRRRVVLGRDRSGQKPIYWSFDKGVLRWASELKGLLGDERPPVSTQAVNDYLRFGYVPAPLTMFEGVYKLPAGCTLVCEGSGTPRVERYWALRYTRDEDRPLSPGEHESWQRRLQESLRAAVERRLESEVRLGFLLSGGVDSASVFALGAEASPNPVDAFTIGFPGEAHDESTVARQVADQWGARHQVRRVKADSVDALGTALYLAEEPLSTDALLPTALVFEQVRKSGFTTVLTGEGSDEIMAGYSKFAAACDWVEGSPAWPDEGSPLERYLAYEEFSFPDPADRERLLGQVVDDSRFLELENEARELDPLGQMLHFEARLRLPDRINPRLDRLSMAWSIEARAPFMDYELQEFCATIPHRLRRGVRTDKLLLRQAMRPYLPDTVLDAAKLPFKAPSKWFVRPSLLARKLSDDAVLDAGMVDPDVVRRMISMDGPASAQLQEQLYSLYVLHTWYQSFVREPPASVSAAVA